MTNWTQWHGQAVKIMDAVEIVGKTNWVTITCKFNGVYFDMPDRGIMLLWADIEAMTAAELAKRLIEGGVG